MNMNGDFKNKQTGLATVELAIVTVAFMTILFGTVEVSRLLFTWNTLDSITQRAARVAAVCPVNHSRIFRVASFGNPDNVPTILPGFDSDDLLIEYLDNDFSPFSAAELAEASVYRDIRYVRASIGNYQHQLAIPFINSSNVSSPPFTSTLPAESMGFIPFEGVRRC